MLSNLKGHEHILLCLSQPPITHLLRFEVAARVATPVPYDSYIMHSRLVFLDCRHDFGLEVAVGLVAKVPLHTYVMNIGTVLLQVSGRLRLVHAVFLVAAEPLHVDVVLRSSVESNE